MAYEQDRFGDHPLFTLENVYNAYRRCRRHKRKTFNAMAFEQNLEENLISLREEMITGTYSPGRSVAFLMEKPKQREIFAAGFRDRVVHHILVGHLEPEWERRFIHDSFACRKGRGTHKGVERVRSFTRKVTANGTRRAWYLQLDIRGFFISIDRKILFERLAAKENDPAVLWLIRTLVFHEPAENCRLRRTRPEDLDKLPPHKTLFKAAPQCGLPIGNLTSQFFANVYLDALDQFVKHRLKARHYVRYCDDFLILSERRDVLESCEAEIRAFLREKLHLQLNERRRLRPVSDGIDFLGYIVRPDYLLVRRRVVKACIERLTRAEALLNCKFSTPDIKGVPNLQFGRGVYLWDWRVLENIYHWLNSYLGHFRKAASHRLIKRIRTRFPWLDEYFVWKGRRIAYAFPRPKPALRLSQQKVRFSGHLPGHILIVQTGNRREVWGGHPESPLPEGLRRFHESRLPEIRSLLWESGLPVAWVGETGTRVTGIGERVLVCRWTGADMRPLSQISNRKNPASAGT